MEPSNQQRQKVQRVVVSGKEAQTPEGKARVLAALLGRDPTPRDVEEFRKLAAKQETASLQSGSSQPLTPPEPPTN